MNEHELIHIHDKPSQLVMITSEEVQPYMKCNKNYVETCHSLNDIHKNDIFCILEYGTYVKATCDPYINDGIVQVKCILVKEKYYGHH